MSIRQDERECAVFRSRRMYQTDMESDIATAEDRGMAKGMAKSMADVARNMLRRNKAIDEIVEDTGLTLEQIEELRATN